MKKILLVAVTFFCAFEIYACINGETRELKDGTIISNEVSQENYVIPLGHVFNKIDYGKKAKQFYETWLRTKNIGYYSDYGILLLLNKEYEKAEQVYLDIEKRKPGLYSTASNLGTLYELMGENEKALEWITRSYKINPQSHRNSEWLHMKILEAKIKGPSYVNADFLLNTNFGNADTPVTKLRMNDLYALRESIYYQLNERVSFIKPKDPIVALLLFEQGNIAWLTRDSGDTHRLYEMAKEYGYSDPLLEIRDRKVQGKTVPQKAVIKETNVKASPARTGYLVWTIIAIVLFSSIIIYFLRRKRPVTVE